MRVLCFASIARSIAKPRWQLCRLSTGVGRWRGKRKQLPLPLSLLQLLPCLHNCAPSAPQRPRTKQVGAAYLQPRFVGSTPPPTPPHSLTPPLASLPSCFPTPPHIVVVIILWSFPFCGQLQLGFNLYFFVVVRSYFIVRPAMPHQHQHQQQRQRQQYNNT